MPETNSEKQEKPSGEKKDKKKETMVDTQHRKTREEWFEEIV